MNTVFETKPVRRGPAAAKEKIREFLEREGRPEAAPIRDWIEHWYDQLPSDKQRDIRGRMRFGDGQQFTSAYFELQMFAMLRRMGYDITVEPRLADGRYTPDFLARHGDEAFYLEATVCGYGAGGLQGTTNEYDAVEKIRAAFEDEGIEIHSNLWLQAEGVLDQTLSRKRVSRPFIDLMRRTTAAEVQRSYESGPCQYWHRRQCGEVVEHGAWRLEGILGPKPPGCATAYVWGPDRSACGDATEAIRASLAEKARPWRKMGPPDGMLVVTMSVCHSQYFWKHGDEWNDGDETRAIAGRLDKQQSRSPLARGAQDHQRHPVRRRRFSGQRTGDQSKTAPEPGTMPAEIARIADEGARTGRAHRIPLHACTDPGQESRICGRLETR